MIAVAVACLPVVFTGARIARWEGLLFVVYYGIYTAFLYIRQEQLQLMEPFNLVMFAFVLPMTVLGLGLAVLRALRTRSKPISNQSDA